MPALVGRGGGEAVGGGLRLTNGPLGASASDTIGALLTVLRSRKKRRAVCVVGNVFSVA